MKKKRNLGRAFERRVFGFQADKPESFEDLGMHQAYEKARHVALARGWNPRNPPDRTLIARLFKELSRVIEDVPVSIEVWPSLGTLLDHRFGIDGFLVVKVNKGVLCRRSRCTIPFDLNITARGQTEVKNLVLTPRSFCGEGLRETVKLLVATIKSKLT